MLSGDEHDYQNQKRILHDYSNQIHCIYGLLQSRKYQDAQEYATKLVGYMEENMEIIDVKNTILNVVLNKSIVQLVIKIFQSFFK